MKTIFINKSEKSHTVILWVILVIILLSSGIIKAQGGYVIYRNLSYPDTTIYNEKIGLPFSPNPENVKSIGMGKTQLANGKQFNAMMYNPAFLSRKKNTLDILNVSVSMPSTTFEAANFVRNNQSQLKDGYFLQQVYDSYIDFAAAQTYDDYNNALKKLKSALEFPTQLSDKVIGDYNDPDVHGVRIIPNISGQFGNFGFSLSGTGQAGFIGIPTNAMIQLRNMQIPNDVSEITPEFLLELAAIAGEIYDGSNNISLNVLPQMFAMSYADIVGAVGYGYSLDKNFHVGANLKVINRRLSTKFITAENYEHILVESGKELKKNVTGFTIDIGALYKFEKTGTEIGLSVQNLIPVTKIASSINIDANLAGYDYVRDQNTNQILVGYVDQNGNYTPDPGGDTLLYQIDQMAKFISPFELNAPLLINAGVVHPVNKDWDVALDWVDIIAQDEKYDNYFERIRIGTEYRLLNDYIAIRAGFSDVRLTAGLGFNLRYFHLDAAYAYDNFVGDYSFFGQIRFGL